MQRVIPSTGSESVPSKSKSTFLTESGFKLGNRIGPFHTFSDLIVPTHERERHYHTARRGTRARRPPLDLPQRRARRAGSARRLGRHGARRARAVRRPRALLLALGNLAQAADAR